MEWKHQIDDQYCVTGVDRRGKRFRLTFNNWFAARCINVWRGSKWLVRNGKRTLICRIYN